MGCNCGKGGGVSVAALKKAAPLELPKVPKSEANPMPSLLDKARGAVASMKEIAHDPSMADKEVQSKRLAVCDKCPSLYRLTGNCTKCGCFVAMKVKFQVSSCPLGKW